MKNFFTNVWDWLNGKKSVIGAAILIAAKVQPYVPAAHALTPVMPYVTTLGVSMGGAGILHYIYKAGQAATPVVALLPESHVRQIASAVVAEAAAQQQK